MPPGPHPGAKNTVFYDKLCLQAPTQHQKHRILQHKRGPVSLLRLTFAGKVVIFDEKFRFFVIYVAWEAKKSTVKHLLFEH